MNYRDISEDKEVLALIKKGNDNLGILGYTEHSIVHVSLVANRASMILKKLGYDENKQELVKIAAFMHDIGNSINRDRHGEYGSLLANEILKRYDISFEERINIASAIANHDENTGGAFDEISAALIIADKSDVRRNRVRKKPKKSFDIHDRVNYAVTETTLDVDREKKTIALSLKIDESICTLFEYFEIFLGRMMMCRKACEMLDVKFKLMVNDNRVL